MWGRFPNSPLRGKLGGRTALIIKAFHRVEVREVIHARTITGPAAFKAAESFVGGNLREVVDFVLGVEFRIRIAGFTHRIRITHERELVKD